MSLILLPRRASRQPQTIPRIRNTHPLAKDITFAMVGSNPFVNAATGNPVVVTPGGSGFSQKNTPYGTALYTPNGGWADFAINQEWMGPQTVIALCRVIDIDMSWGAMFSKEGTGTNTQFLVGRWSTEDVLQGAMVGTAQKLLPGTVSELATAFNVLTFTHTGASAGMNYYRNGALVGTSSTLPDPQAGYGPLGLGRSNGSSATGDADVEWILFLHLKRVLSASEVKEVGSNLWPLFETPVVPIYFADAAPPPPPAGGYGFVKVSGSWKTLSGTYVKVAGVWKQGHFSPKVSGSWKTLV